MQPIHFAIGVIEGIITAAVLCFVYKMQPEILESQNPAPAAAKIIFGRKIIIALAVVTILAGGVLSIFSSSKPDGLEWSIEKTTGSTAGGELLETLPESIAKIQSATAFMPDYAYKLDDNDGHSRHGGTSVAGIVGSAFVFLLVWLAAFIISAVKKRQKQDFVKSA
jgi:cobalt/nickel transport system permease protein